MGSTMPGSASTDIQTAAKRTWTPVQSVRGKLEGHCREWPEPASDVNVGLLLAGDFQAILVPCDESKLCPEF